MHGLSNLFLLFVIGLSYNFYSTESKNLENAGYSSSKLGKIKSELSSNKDDIFVGPIVTCAVCHVAAKGLVEVYKQQSTEECLEAIAIKVCEMFKIEDSMVCSSIIPLFLDEVLYVFGKLILTPDQFCGFILPDECGNAYHPRKTAWNVTFPDIPKPPLAPLTLPRENAPKLRVLHLSDIHFDKLYRVGSMVDCDDPLCCRLYETTINGSTETAGKWGNPNGNCDLPEWTLENLLQHLQANETFDYIIWTGDLPAHNVWNQTKSDQLTAYKQLTDLFLQYFPDKIIFSAVGNHESSPVNSFPPHYPDLPEVFDISWLYDALAESWTNWVNKSETNNIKNIASFVAKPFPGLRIISLNTIYCYSDNYWVYLNETDPDGALSWLVEQLQEAEDVGDKVHIIGHILPGHCLPQWSLNYFDIIYRYEATVTGQFFGHTHSDEFAVFYENENYTQRAFSMYYVGPSVTTYSNRNPAYRIYTIDGNYSNSTWRVLNHETYYLNLSKANANKNNLTEWEFEYDAKTAFGLTTLFPEDWSNLINVMKENDTIFERYNTFYDRMPKNCEGSCKEDKICEARSAVANFQDSLCHDIYDSTKSASNVRSFDKTREMEVALKRLEKMFPNGINIGIPSECEATSTTSTEVVCTTQQCHCGRGGRTVKVFSGLLLLCIFILIMWK